MRAKLALQMVVGSVLPPCFPLAFESSFVDFGKSLLVSEVRAKNGNHVQLNFAIGRVVGA